MTYLLNPFTFGGCSGDAISTTSLAAYYKFNGTATDSGPNGLNATLTGSPTYTTGKYSDAINLNGTSQYAVVSDSTFLEGSSGNISVFCWVKITDFSSELNQHAVSKWTASNGWRLVLQSTGNILVSLAATNVGRGSGIPTGSWVHIGFTYNNSTLKVYYNGSQAGTDATVSSATLANSQEMHIGKRSSGTDGYVKGQIDEVNVWQRVLSSTEVSTLYNSTCPLKS
jgi:hypothetical protein